MFREIREWVHLALLYGLLYSSALVVLVLGIAHLSNDTNKQAYYSPPQKPSIIYKTIVQSRASGYEPDVCNRIDGCIVKDGVCLTCIKGE